MPEGLPRHMGHTTPAVAGAQQSAVGTVCLSDGEYVGHHAVPQATRGAPSCRRGATGLPEELSSAAPGPHCCMGSRPCLLCVSAMTDTVRRLRHGVCYIIKRRPPRWSTAVGCVTMQSQCLKIARR